MKRSHYWDDTAGQWVDATPEPFYWGLFPWIWLRLTGWRDEYGRKDQLATMLESWCDRQMDKE